MYKRGYNCRCKHCDARVTLRMKPEHYYKRRRCRVCGKHDFRVDWFRMRKEFKKYGICNCHGYGFQHRKGSGWCVHNPRERSDAEVRFRYGMAA